jgi:1-acyl-sn-glycerol-3-phosphate acyltransferase
MILSLLHFLRVIIGLVDLTILTALMYLLSFLPTKVLGTWYRKCFRYWCKVFVRALGVDLKLHQKNQFPLPQQYILIGNHPSALEDVGVPALMDVSFLAKKEVQHWFIVGRISRAAGTFYFDRQEKDSRKEAVQILKDALEKGVNIGLYPEGGCKGRRIFLPFRYGAFDLSLTTNVPIVPLFLHYESQEDFEWLGQHLLLKLWQILTSQNRRAHYYVYDAIDPADFKDKESYCEHVQNLYLQWQQRYLL